MRSSGFFIALLGLVAAAAAESIPSWSAASNSSRGGRVGDDTGSAATSGAVVGGAGAGGARAAAALALAPAPAMPVHRDYHGQQQQQQRRHEQEPQQQQQERRRRDLLSSSADAHAEYDKGENYTGEPTELTSSAPLNIILPAAPVLGPNGLVRLAHPPYMPPQQRRPNEGVNDHGHEVLVLAQHNFRHPKPFVGSYTPPGTDFNRVVLNLSVSSTQGFQRDRIGSLYLGDVEVWRMSTVSARPGQDLQWGFLKDATAYLALWKQPHTIVVDLPNSVDDGENSTYTGCFNVTISATFFRTLLTKDKTPHPPADAILPLSAGRAGEGAGSAWEYPRERATKMVELPRNAHRAHVSIAATGQDKEEYWWSNVPDSRAGFFANSSGTLPAGTGVREIRLSIDGYPAGIAWPFPAVMAGGIAAPMNRPAAPPQAFDLRESEIDVSVWLPYLSDGRPHNFTLDVFQFHHYEPEHGNSSSSSSSANNNESDTEVLQGVKVETSHWLLSAKLFLWLDPDPEAITTGSLPVVDQDLMRWKVDGNTTRNLEGESHGLTYDVRVYRLLRLKTRRVTTQNGTEERMWQQQLVAYNRGYFNREFRRGIHNIYEGRSESYTDRAPYFHESYEYPLHVLLNYLLPDSRDGSFALRTRMTHGAVTKVVGKTAFVTGVEPWIANNNHWRDEAIARGSCSHFTRTGESTQMQNADGTLMLGIGDVRESFRFGATSHHIDSLKPGCSPQPLLYRRDLLKNGTRFRDRTWTYKLDEPFLHEDTTWDQAASSYEDDDLKADHHEHPPNLRFPTINMEGGAWKMFMGVPLDAL